MRKIILLAAILGVAAAPASPVTSLAGQYRYGTAHAEIIPVDARHAYVHLAYLYGIQNEKICDFEGVMTSNGRGLVYHGEDLSPGQKCTLAVRRVGSALLITQPNGSGCEIFGDCFHQDGLPWSSKRPVSRTSKIKSDGGAAAGYQDTVAAWRKSGG